MGRLSGQAEEGSGSCTADLLVSASCTAGIPLRALSSCILSAVFATDTEVWNHGLCLSRRFSLAESILFDVFKFYPVCCGLGLHAKGS